MLGTALIVLKGLSTLRVLRDFILGILGNEVDVIQSIKPRNTIIKSKIFQPSLKYAFLWNTRPIPIIFKVASTAKNVVKK
jgi:hypothetical protein